MTQTMPALFLADSRGLDFLNSIATPVDVPVDWLDDGEGLLGWLQQAQLVPAEVIRAARAGALPGELDRLAGQARSLREWFRGFVYEHKGRPLQPTDLRQLEPLNQLLKRDEGFSEIVLTDQANAFSLLHTRRWNSPEALLLPIAESMARLICDENFSFVKACEGPACTLLFADHTRGHARRWCSMAICGNRAKQAAHRRRIKPAASEA
ncbi:CGNR zinc finger domain-containing protein [Dyella acidiphila]|uniref:CGNR zinc finger domain-containing protein n=1 Tax=Dyella acidiphila TaxID=2775866 RepID=A0ABR9GDW0_9GAMM|nr:ABATE domain-containing protein [Dyella acidiphila]MBE1162240.1 CGNR zinc finger domain-containing protein [Dyella acidiphila]